MCWFKRGGKPDYPEKNLRSTTHVKYHTRFGLGFRSGERKYTLWSQSPTHSFPLAGADRLSHNQQLLLVEYVGSRLLLYNRCKCFSSYKKRSLDMHHTWILKDGVNRSILKCLWRKDYALLMTAQNDAQRSRTSEKLVGLPFSYNHLEKTQHVIRK